MLFLGWHLSWFRKLFWVFGLSLGRIFSISTRFGLDSDQGSDGVGAKLNPIYFIFLKQHR